MIEEIRVKLFTLEEANDLLPTLKQLLEKSDRARAALTTLAPYDREAAARATEGGGTTAGSEYALYLVSFFETVREINSHGIEVKDFERWLCDFPHMRDGRVVFLCWQRGEDSIQWWHDVEAGFAGRQPL